MRTESADDTSPWLLGKRALVTGSAQRLGRAVALALAERGADIIVHYNRSEQAAETLVSEVRHRAREAWKIPADLSQPESAERLFAKAVDVAGPVDILVNNASTFPSSRLLDVTPEAVASSMDLHAIVPLLLSRALADQDRGGQIINLLDTKIVEYDEGHVAYHLGKRALFSLTRMLAVELAPGIRVNAVAPGLILPPPGEDESYLQALAHTNPLNTIGGPEDVADAVLFLLKSPFITGQVIFVDGGRHMKGRMYD